MAGDCNRQIRLCSNSWRASCGFIFYDNIKLNPSLDGIEARGGVGLAGGQAGGLAGCLAISIKWLALKISGRTIKTPFHSGSVKQARQGRREQGELGMGVGVAKAYCPQLPLLCVTKSNNKPIKRPHTIKMAATTFLLPTFWGSQCISGLACCSPSSHSGC